MILNNFRDLNSSVFNRYIHFREFKSLSTLVEDNINCNKNLKDTYDSYQIILSDIKNKNFRDIIMHLEILKEILLDEMKPAFNTLLENIEYIKNALIYPYLNGYTEGTNNYIKTLKKVTFGYMSYYHFRNRILITFNLRDKINI